MDDFYSQLDTEAGIAAPETQITGDVAHPAATPETTAAAKTVMADHYKKFDIEADEISGNLFQRLWGASMRGWMNLGEAAINLPAHTLQQIKPVALSGLADAVLQAKDPKTQKFYLEKMRKRENFFNKAGAELNKAGDIHKIGKEAILRNHPEWESEPSKGFVDLLTHPDKLAVSLAESVPVLLSAGILTAAGQPQMGVGLMYSVEGQEAYDQAIADGASEEDAETCYAVYGSVSAALESMQLKGIMKLGKGMYNRVLNRTAQKVGRKGLKSLTWEVIKESAKEALEEMSQGTWQEATAKMVYDKSVSGGAAGFIDRRAQEGYIGFVMGLLPGASGAGAAYVKSKTMRSQITANMSKELGITKEQSAETIFEATKQVDTNATEEQQQKQFVEAMTKEIEVTRIVSRFPQKITDQKSLEKIGNAIAEHLGVDAAIEWSWSKRPGGRDVSGWQLDSKKGRMIHISPGTKSHVSAGSQGKPTSAGQRYKRGQLVFPSQGNIKRTIIHELGHIAKEYIVGDTGRRKVHHPEFVKWVEDSVKQLFKEETISVKRIATKMSEQMDISKEEAKKIVEDAREKLDKELSPEELKAQFSSSIEAGIKEFYAQEEAGIERDIERQLGEKPGAETGMFGEKATPTAKQKPAKGKKVKPSKAQYAAGHGIPKILKMSTRKRRAFMKKITGKNSMAKMTPSLAQDYIDALHKLAREKGIETGVVPEERKFRKPTLLRYFTPQLYEAEILGVKFMTKPAEIGKQKLDIEFTEQARQVDAMENIINKLGKETFASKARAKAKNKPTKSIQRFAKLLDTHEKAPANLSKEEKAVFNYFRNLSRAIISRENAVRAKLKMPLIPYRKAYVRHITDGLAKEIIDGRHPIPEDIKYWAEKQVKTKIRNPMEFQRQLSNELGGMFSNDLTKITKAMLWTGLKEIHLSEPLKHFENQLGLHSEVIPPATRRWTEQFINIMIKGQQSSTDEGLNNLVTETGLRGLMDKALKPFGRSISSRPLTRLLQKAGRLQIYGVMGWRPKQLIRNKFQLVQNLALYGVKANLKSFLPAGKQLKGMLSESLFLKSYKGFEDLKDIDKRMLGRLWLAPFQWTAISNARQAMECAYYDTLDLVENPKYKNLGWADPKRTYKEEKGTLYPSEKTKVLGEMEFGAGVTQYHYIPMAMPEVFRSKALIPVTRLQSWWMNHFFKFHREAATRLLKGETSYGTKLPWSRRVGWGRYMVIGGMVLNTLGYGRSYLFGAAPNAIPPIGQLLVNLFLYCTTQNDRARETAKRKSLKALLTFIPGYLAYRDMEAIWSGRKDLSHLFFYFKSQEKKKTKMEY